MTILAPPPLSAGSKIGLICPAGFMPPENMQTCVETLTAWGFQVCKGKTTATRHHYFSGTDAERLADLQRMLDDTSVDAILCARGGYGVSRIIDYVNWTRFSKNPKWIIGFSDITVLHSHLLSNLSIASLHAPMAAAFNETPSDNYYINAWRATVLGEKQTYYSNPQPYNISGSCEGVLAGGNLSILIHLLGTKSEFDYNNKILFLEDVGEYIYSIDRMFVQLKRAGKLQQIAGLIIGGFTDSKDTTMPFGTDVYSAIHEHTKDLKIPVCFDFPISHNRENVAIKHGCRYRLTVHHGGELMDVTP